LTSPATIGADGLPLPPLDLANRVGAIAHLPDPFGHFLDVGALSRREIIAALPDDWIFEQRRALDFGCGAGRTLRHFTPEAAHNEIWGCDIDDESVAWLETHLNPPFHATRNDVMPSGIFPDEHFDLIWAISVFTHLADSWSAWLLELHRMLKPGGLLFSTFMGPPLAQQFTGTPGDADTIGMNVLRYDAPWDEGGPMVLHSPWWIRAHWGRAFDVLELRESGFGGGPDYAGHGIVMLRKRDTACSGRDLEAIERDEPREAAALASNMRDQWREIAALRASAGAHDSNALAAAQARVERLTDELATMSASRSWRVTAPLRRVAERAREKL
jgi:SAM-dependent methyltransferase